MKVLILGGTGVLSSAIVAELLRRNVEVSVVTRGQRPIKAAQGTEWIKCDRHAVATLSRELAGRRFDGVIDSICFSERDAKETVELFGDRSDQIIVISSVAAYRRPYRTVPTREEPEELWEDPEYAYAFNKALMEIYLQERASQGVPVTIVRPSLTFGTGARNVGILRQNLGILARIRAGKPLVMFGDGTTPWSFSFAPDVARAIVALLGQKAAIGSSFHIASQELSIWRDLYMEFGRIAGREPLFAYIPSQTLYRALPELCGHLYFEKSFPGLFDDAKLKEVIPDFHTEISLSGGLRSLVESWAREGLEVDPARDLLEDRLVAASESGADAIVAAAKGNGGPANA